MKRIKVLAQGNKQPMEKRESTLDFYLTTGKTNKASRIKNRGGSDHYPIMTTYEIQKPNKGKIDNII